jgi:2-polyprenyl-6-methoxyphenol hydroxylase-like FAD-dependent oxidoreductase
VEGSVGGDGVTAVFDDGMRVSGSVIVGADGSKSMTRKVLRPDNYRNNRLPVRYVGSAVDMTPDQVKPLRQLDPLLFQGCHPDTSCFMWVSMLEVPEINGTAGTGRERYRVQINLSWPVNGVEDEVKPTHATRVQDVKLRAAVFVLLLRKAVQAIPDNAEALEIEITDWPCLEWDNRQGKVTLVGDVAYVMTMYRGEAANHGTLMHIISAAPLNRYILMRSPRSKQLTTLKKKCGSGRLIPCV